MGAIVVILVAGLAIVGMITIFGHGDNTTLLTLIISSTAAVIAGILGLLKVATNKNGDGDGSKKQ